MRLSFLPALALLAAALCEIPASLAQQMTPVKPATIWYSEQFTIHSKTAGRDFLIQIAKLVRQQAAKAPVVYVLDGNNLFGEAAVMATAYGYFGDAAPAYVVGIGYPEADFGQWLSLRNHDLLHVRLPAAVGATGSGGGADFQKFLQEELRPLIASRYLVDDRQAVLVGHSFGGLFTSHVLLNAPRTFSAYIACSPSIWAEPQLLEKASAFHVADAPKVFIGVGSKEQEQFGEKDSMVRNAQELADRLKSHPSGARVSFTDFAGQTHGTSLAECLSHGLRFVLPPPKAAAGH